MVGCFLVSIFCQHSFYLKVWFQYFNTWGQKKTIRLSQHQPLTHLGSHVERKCAGSFSKVSWWDVVPLALINFLCVNCCLISSCCYKNDLNKMHLVNLSTLHHTLLSSVFVSWSRFVSGQNPVSESTLWCK